MNETKNMLTVVDGETLMDMKLPPTKFCVETLLPQGISILGGAPIPLFGRPIEQNTAKTLYAHG